RHAEALERYLWAFDHGRGSSAFFGVRLSYLLGKLVKLGSVYPESLKSLQARREAAHSRLIEGTGTRYDVHDVLALDRALNGSDQMDELRNMIEAKGFLVKELREAFVGEERGRKKAGQLMSRKS